MPLQHHAESGGGGGGGLESGSPHGKYQVL